MYINAFDKQTANVTDNIITTVAKDIKKKRKK